MSEIRSIRLVCTRRNAHKPKLLHVWRIHGDMVGLTVDTFVPLSGSWWEPTPCSRCGLAPRIGHETQKFVEQLVDALDRLRAGEWSVTLDASQLGV